jgi:hypothetical protein
MLSDNRAHFLLGVMLTSLCVMTYKELSHRPPVVETKTETIVHMVNDPLIRGNFELESSEIKSTLNKSKLKHLLIYINALCDEYAVDYDMVKAVIQTESSWNHKAVSTSGAIGLMQILPTTAMDEFNTPEKDLDWSYYWLDNMQTLCKPCHKEKTKQDRKNNSKVLK